MAKTTKRSRKFAAKGGVKARLEKGTVTKKGKLKGRGKKHEKNVPEDETERNNRNKALSEEEDRKKKLRDDADFCGDDNLGDLDMESFFKAATAEDGDDMDEDDAVEDSKEDGNMSDDDSDEDSDSGSDSEMDDEDLAKAEQAMRLEMEKMESKDPDFHKFLSKNESSLLEFGEDADEGTRNMDNDEDESKDEEMEDNDGSDDDSGEDKKTQKKKDDTDSAPKEKVDAKAEKPESKLQNGQIHLTLTVLKSYEKSAFHAHGMKGLRQIVNAFRTASHLSDPQQRGANAGVDDGSAPSGSKRFYIDSPVVFDRLIVLALQRCHEAFLYHLIGEGSKAVEAHIKKSEKKKDTKTNEKEKNKEEEEDDETSIAFDENKPINPKTLMKARRWKEMSNILEIFLKSTMHILSEAKEPELLSFILKNLSKYIPILTAFPRISKYLTKTFTSLWCAPVDDAQTNHQAVRLQAFLRIRQLALTQPFPFIEDCLKHVYLAYAKSSKFTSETTLPTLTFMGNCVVELYSVDMASSYQHAFVYIRQLALHLRSALQKKTKEAFKVVYCWQFLNCLKVWTAVLCANPDESELKSLVYPLTEIIFGVIRLLPTARYLPIRFHCIRLLQQLAASTYNFIPTTSVLLETLDLKEVGLKPKKANKSNRVVVRLPLIVKLPKEDTLRTIEQLDTCISEVFVLLNREVDLYRYSPGYPEFTVRICQRLRKFSKETKNGRWRAFSKGCIEMCNRYSEYAIKQRSLVSEAPKDIKRLEFLKPQNAPDMKTRYETAAGNEKRLQAASNPVQSVPTKKKETEKQLTLEVEKKEKTVKTKKKKTKKTVVVDQNSLKNVDALEEVDEVAEGIDWSSDEDSE